MWKNVIGSQKGSEHGIDKNVLLRFCYVPVNSRNKCRFDSHTHQIFLVETLGIEYCAHQRYQTYKHSVKIATPSRLIILHESNQKIDNLRTGKL